MLIRMQMLTGASNYYFSYNMTIADPDTIENFIDTSNVLFACLAAANLYYDLFEKLVEGLFYLPISNTPENPVIGIYYRQYSELVISTRPTSNCNRYEEDTFDINMNNNRKVVDNRAVNDGVVDNGTANNNDDKGEDNNQNSDKDYTKE